MKQNSTIKPTYSVKLSDSDFKKLASFIEKESGIQMPDHKKIMVQGRLKKRIVALNLSSYTDYTDYLLNPANTKNEILDLLSCISTNKTDFFREPMHFKFLETKAVPEIYALRKGFKIWSAGCSSGEEAYTTAVVFEELTKKFPELDYTIHGTDISMKVLQMAQKAEYNLERAHDIPTAILRKYFLKHRDPEIKKIRVAPEIRSKVSFSYLNLMEKEFHLNETFDIIFLRNVLIYFNRAVQKEVIKKVMTHLKPDGYLFLGHSESIFEQNIGLKSVGPNMYKKIIHYETN